MALHLTDAFDNVGFWPWPQESWLFNKPVLDAIAICQYMIALLKKKDKDWTEHDSDFYQAIHKEQEPHDSS